MSNNSNSKVQFVKGQVITVWKTVGVRQGKDNMPTTSERLGLDYPDIEVSEPLLVLQKVGSTKAIVKRTGREGHPDDQTVVHINHVNPASSYYANRVEKLKAGVKKLTPEEELAKAQAELEAAARNLESLKAKVAAAPATPSETPAAEPVELVQPADRDEAASLFENAEA